MEQVINYLLKTSSLKPEEREQISKQRLTEDGLIMRLIKYSCIPQVKFMAMERYLDFAPLYQDRDLFLTINYNSKYNGHFLSCKVYDLLVIDIDGIELDLLAKKLNNYYPDERFFIHQTSENSFHVIVMSRPIKYNSMEAIEKRIRLNSDICHSHISLYQGCGVRLVSKFRGKPYLYPKVIEVGRGVVDERCLRVYNKIMNLHQKFFCYDIYSFNESSELRNRLYQIWQKTVQGYENSIWLTQIFESCPSFLVRLPNGEIVYNNIIAENEPLGGNRGRLITRLLRNKCFRHCRSGLNDRLIDESVRSSSIYHMLVRNSEYAIGVDIPVNFHFIVFQNLLLTDYDHKNRIKILYEFCRYNPGYKFRVYETTKGYHCFLTSRAVNYQSKEARDLLTRLGSDTLYNGIATKKGFSVRINPKTPEEKMSTTFKIVGTGREIPKLVKLVELHARLIRETAIMPSVQGIANQSKLNAKTVFDEYVKDLLEEECQTPNPDESHLAITESLLSGF